MSNEPFEQPRIKNLAHSLVEIVNPSKTEDQSPSPLTSLDQSVN